MAFTASFVRFPARVADYGFINFLPNPVTGGQVTFTACMACADATLGLGVWYLLQPKLVDNAVNLHLTHALARQEMMIERSR